MHITSASNDRIKHARRVRDGREPELIFVEGLRLGEECLRSGCEVEACFAGPDQSQRGTALLEELARRHIPVLWTSTEVIENLSGTIQTQGFILLAKRPPPAAPEAFASHTLLLALDRIQDPGNMGTLLRTAEAAGVGGILILGGSVDIFSPKVLRSSMGSAFRIPVLTEADAQSLLSLRTARHFNLTAATGGSGLDYCTYDWRQPTLLILGNEGRGVDDTLLHACDTRLRIPMASSVESLNVAAAGAVMLFEAARQRRLTVAQHSNVE